MTAALGLLLRPVWMIDSPVGLPDGSWRRLGGSLLWYQAIEVRRAGMPPVHVAVSGLDRWLEGLSDGDRVEAEAQLAAFGKIHPPIVHGQRTIRLDTPQIMAILNMTPDSFSDGGRHGGDPDAVAEAAFAMGLAGASIIDVGGESTRPGATAVWEGDEIARVVPIIERLARADLVVSVDTRKAAVMEAALAAGAAMVNDVSALAHDPRSLDVVARAGCPVVLMHAPSAGPDPHVRPASPPQRDPVAEIWAALRGRIDVCVGAGIARDRIIVNPGIGFGKTLAENVAILNRLATFHGLGCPILLGASRKRIIGALSNEAPVGERLGGSVALALEGARAGTAILRVHDVAENVQAVRVWRGLRDGALSAPFQG